MGDSPLIRKPAIVAATEEDKKQIHAEMEKYSRQSNVAAEKKAPERENLPGVSAPSQAAGLTNMGNGYVADSYGNAMPVQYYDGGNVNANDDIERLLPDFYEFRMVLCKGGTREYTNVKGRYIVNPALGNAQFIEPPKIREKNRKYSSFTPIANFVITAAAYITLDYGYRYNEGIRIDCQARGNYEFQILISTEDFNKRIIKKVIEKEVDFPAFTTNVGEKKINELLYNYIKGITSKETYELKYKPGFYREEDIWKFVSHDENNFRESDNIRNSRFTVRSFKCDEEAKNIVERFFKSIVENGGGFLHLFRLAALLHTPLASIGYTLDKALIISGCDSNEKKKLLNAYLQVYNRDDENSYSVLPMDMKDSDLRNTLLNHKDCVLILDDKSTISPYQKKKNQEKMEWLTNIFSQNRILDGHKVECQCAVVSDRFMMESFADENCLFYDMRNIEKINSSEVRKLNYEFDQIVVDFVKTLFDKYKDNFKVIDEESAEDFDFESSKNAYKTLGACISILKKICELYDCRIFSENDYQVWYDSVYDQIMDSECFNDEDTIIGEFRDYLSWCVCKNKISLVDDNILNADVDSGDVIYVKKGLLIIDTELFYKLVGNIKVFSIDKGGIRLRKILAEQGYLVTNSGDGKYLYRTSVAGNGNRPYYVAITTNILDEDAREFLPAKGEAVYHALPDDNSVERIKLGVTESCVPFYWSIGAPLRNKNIFIRGAIGSGKTYLLTSLAKKLHDAGKRVVVFDYSQPSGYDEFELKKVLSEEYIEQNITICKKPTFDFVTENEDKIVIASSSVAEAEQLLMDIYNYCSEHKVDGKETYVVFDEAALMSINRESPLGKAILYGRKINLCILAATQILSGEGVRERTKLLNQSALKIALPLDPATAREVAGENSDENIEEFVEVIKGLKRGEALVYGDMENSKGDITTDRKVKIKITVD